MKIVSFILLSFLMPIAHAGWVDSSQFRVGATWIYSHNSQSLITGTVQRSYSGVQVWRIDSVKANTFLTSWIDSGFTTTQAETLSQVHRFQAWFGYGGNGFYPVSGDTLMTKSPLFAVGNLLDETIDKVVVGLDTLRMATRSRSPCVSEWVQFLEHWGLVKWSGMTACGITSSSHEYTLLASEGRAYHDSLVKSLPKPEPVILIPKEVIRFTKANRSLNSTLRVQKALPNLWWAGRAYHLTGRTH